MKTGSLLVILAIVLGVLGAGLSYSGYNESLHVRTVTNTQSYTSAFTKNIPSTRTEIIVITTSSTLSILDQTLDIPGIKNTNYCGYYDYVSSTLEAGKVNVSYGSDREPVDFWMLSEAQFKQFESRRFGHGCEPGVPYIAQKLRSSSYEFTKDIQTSATYYFVILNKNNGPVSITLHVDRGVQTSVLTRTNEEVDYLTQVSPFVTETKSFSSHPVGFGPLFYSGVGLVVVAGILLVIGRMKGAAPRPTQVSPVVSVAPVLQAQAEDSRYVGYVAKLEELKTRRKISDETYQRLRDEYGKKLAGVAPSPLARTGAEPATGKFCMNCGALLPVHVTFCSKCGAKQ
jgi:ribosomal protein L40E